MMKHRYTTLSTVLLYVLFCSTVLGRPVRRNQDTICFYDDSLQDIQCLSEIVSTATKSGTKIVDYLRQNPNRFHVSDACACAGMPEAIYTAS